MKIFSSYILYSFTSFSLISIIILYISHYHTKMNRKWTIIRKKISWKILQKLSSSIRNQDYYQVKYIILSESWAIKPLFSLCFKLNNASKFILHFSKFASIEIVIKLYIVSSIGCSVFDNNVTTLNILEVSFNFKSKLKKSLDIFFLFLDPKPIYQYILIF